MTDAGTGSAARHAARSPRIPGRGLAGLALVGLVLSGLWLGGLLRPDSSASVETLDVSAVLSAPRMGLNAAPEGGTVGLSPGDYAPDFEFSEFSGRRVRLSDFRGSPVAINFWASWCGPCETELPVLASALDTQSAGGLAIIAVNFGETYRRASAFIQDAGVNLTAVAFDPAHEIGDAYGVRGLPATCFVDAQGVITGWVMGELDNASLGAGIAAAAAGWGPSSHGIDPGSRQ